MKKNMIVMLLSCSMLIACGESNNEGAAAQAPTKQQQPLLDNGKTVLRKANGAEPQTLDPHRAEGVASSNILRDLYEGLVSETPKGELIPGAAERWEMNADGTVYTFYLRKNAVWSNGKPVTANDFVYGLQRSVDPATGSNYSMILAPIKNVEEILQQQAELASMGVKALGSHVLQITLKAPTPYFLGLLTHSTTYPIYRDAVAEHGDQFTRPGNAVTNGAYQITEWSPQSHIRLERNSHYWDNSKTAIDAVEYYAIENQEAALQRYRAGELDWADSIPIERCEWVRDNLKAELKIHPYLGTYYYGFNLNQAPFKNNPKLRRALSLAVDREVLVQKVTKCGELAATGWVPPGILNYQSQSFPYAGWTKQQREQEAKRLYAEAGFSAANPAEFTILYNTSEGHKKIAVALSAMWKQTLGVKTTLENQEWKVYLTTRKQKQKTQAFRAGWIGDYNDANTFAEIFQASHGMNDVGFTDLEYDKLLKQAAVETDMQVRKGLLEQAENRLLEAHAILPLYFYVNKTLLKPWVQGHEGNIMDHHYTKNLTIQH